MRQLTDKLLDIFFPPQCVGCAAKVSQVNSFCHDCWKGITFISKPCCSICGVPFPTRNEGDTCLYCLKVRPDYIMARSVVRFDDNISALVHALKYYDRTELAPAMAMLMHRYHKDIVVDADIICPIPLHPNRLKKRKYNQSLILAKHLAQLGRKVFVRDLLVRGKDIPSQSGLNRTQRFRNVSGAFKLNDRYYGTLQDKKVLIVDDVITTGATLNECAVVLKGDSNAKTYGLSFARSY